MTTFLSDRDPGDENDSEREDVCPTCGEYLPFGPYGIARYTCGDCWGGTDRDFYARGADGPPAYVSELERGWMVKRYGREHW